VNYIHCPSGEQSWDNPKWSNQPGFAVGCGRNSAEQAHAIYAIDLDKKSFLQIVTGTELQEPFLWTGVSFIIDSFGMYNDPPTTLYQSELATKILMCWRLYDTIEVAMIGSSQAQGGFDPSKINGLAAYNLASKGGDLLTQKNVILNYLLPYWKKLKYICSSLDIGWLCYSDGDVNWGSGFGNSKGFKYDSCHDFWVKNFSSDEDNTLRSLIKLVPIPVPSETLNSGFVMNSPQGWGGNPPPIQGDLTWTVNDVNFQQNLATIRMIADSLRDRQIHWIVVNFPVSPYYRNSAAYSVKGPSWQTAHDILDTLRKIDFANEYFHFYDANKDGNHDYDSADAYDQNHMSYLGGRKLSIRVDSIIHTILP
jgi:hypothetical protein